MKNYKSNYSNQTRAQNIDIDSIYCQLREAIERRNNLQEKQDIVWAKIKRTRSNGHAEMCDIDNRIGQATHRVNSLISELCMYRKTHRAMNLAYNYLSNEKRRISGIISHQEQTIRDVERGRQRLINSYGVTHTDTTHLREYVSKKRCQLAQLNKWQQHVAHYMA